MPGDDEALAWMTLSRTPGVDAPTLRAVLTEVGTARALLAAPNSAAARFHLREETRAYLCGSRGHATRSECAWVSHASHHVVSMMDTRFPSLLGRALRSPIALYVSGHVEVLNDPQLAIVGSRNPTPAGRDIAYAFAEQLAECGLAITSGLAEGIDSAAHEGALRAQGVTVAVLGCGLDQMYPRSNTALGERILAQGALVSEFPLGEPPRRANFPRRNAIIATMTLGTLVVEATPRSGSLITARLAADHNRELFAIPGSIHNPLSRGCHELIRGGAKLTQTIADILSELNFSAFFANRSAADVKGLSPPPIEGGMDKEHKILLDALGFDPADLDDLVVRTGLKPDAVSSMMLILELEGHVQAAPGGRYSRVVRSRR